MQLEFASCCRDGLSLTLQARELVPGDAAQVRVGDKIPADTRIIDIKTSSLMIEQSQLMKVIVLRKRLMNYQIALRA